MNESGELIADFVKIDSRARAQRDGGRTLQTEIAREMNGEEKAKALAKIPISNDTVKRRISSMSEDNGTMHRAPP